MTRNWAHNCPFIVALVGQHTHSIVRNQAVKLRCICSNVWRKNIQRLTCPPKTDPEVEW